MNKLNPLRDNVMAKMIEPVGALRKTHGGVLMTEHQQSEEFVRARWFVVTHVGPEQNDVTEGQYVLVSHGRWSRGIDFDNTHLEADKLFLIDNDELLMVSDIDPLS
jgi:co-chaperonin GroES (HSP10)